MESVGGGLKVLFASETGNSAKVAEMIHLEAVKRGFRSSIYELNGQGTRFDLTQYMVDEENKEPHVCAIVCSSTGNGDAPRNGQKFVKWLRRNRAKGDSFLKTRFCILGLGDSNYSKYQGVPIYIQEKLKALGGREILRRGEVDDALGQPEAAIEPWVAELWGALEKESEVLRGRPRLLSNKSADGQHHHPVSYKNPARLRVQAVRVLTGEQAVKHVHELRLALDDEHGDLLFDVEVGGAVSVLPQNSEAELLRFLNFFEFPADFEIMNSPSSLERIQRDFCALPPLPFLRALAPYLSDPSSLLLLRSHIDQYPTLVRDPMLTCFQLLERVLDHERLRILNLQDFHALLALLPAIRARQYSVLLQDRSLIFAVSPHFLPTGRIGFCSGYLSALRPGDELCCFPTHKSSIFKLDYILKTRGPTLLIAHGTSVTPFLAFLARLVQLRISEGKGPIVLLYGFRSSKAEFSDKLYASELEGIFDYLREQYHPGCRTVCAESYKELEEGCCDDCEVGEWRSGIRMKTSYVQDLLVGERRLLEEIVCGGAGEVLVCGEGSEMARSVEHNMELLLAKRVGGSVLAALGGRYRKETWSSSG